MRSRMGQNSMDWKAHIKMVYESWCKAYEMLAIISIISRAEIHTELKKENFFQACNNNDFIACIHNKQY